MTDWYRQSRWQLECGQTLWQDLQQHYSSSDWQQRSRRLAYQTAILQYLKKAVQALMAALASDNNFLPAQEVAKLDWTVIDQVLQQQNYIPAAWQQIQQLQRQGWLADLRIACQCLNNPERSKTKQQNFSVGLIPLQDQQRVSDLDQWPLGDWLHEMQALQHSLYTEQQEW